MSPPLSSNPPPLPVPSPLRILIVGASIAGPTAAYWFSRLPHTRITVLERYPHLRPGGQNIDIRTAGVTVMRRMEDLESRVQSAKVEMEGLSFVSEATGRRLGTIRATGNPDQQSLVSEYEIFRGELSRILVGMTEGKEGVRYVFGEQVKAIRRPKPEGGDEKATQEEEEEGGVGAPLTVEFLNGVLPTSEYDLVVACDGATSRTRALGFDCGVRDHMHSTNCWAAYFSIEKDLLDGSGYAQGTSAPGGRFLGMMREHGTGRTRVAMMGMHPRDGSDATAPFREASKAGDQQLKEYVKKEYAGLGWKAPEALKYIDEADDFYGSEIAQVKLPKLYRGRFVVVGDAGYAPGLTGGGTTLAMAGAYLLAGEIGKHRGDLRKGLEAYEERMQPLIKEMQKMPPFISSFMAPQTRWGIWIRDTIFAFVTWTRVLEVAQKYLAGAFANADQFPLPEYDWEK